MTLELQELTSSSDGSVQEIERSDFCDQNELFSDVSHYDQSVMELELWNNSTQLENKNNPHSKLFKRKFIILGSVSV
jgi:hypothetical protein